MLRAITNCRIYTGMGILNNHSIICVDGKIADVVRSAEIPAQMDQLDLQGANIAPAFIDLQIYGGNGYLFSESLSAAAIKNVNRYCRDGGCGAFLLTMATNEPTVISKGISVAKKYLAEHKDGFLGLHIEGPWINPEKKGAHLAKYIHEPTLEEVRELIEESDGVIRMITLAPEMVAPEIIDLLQENEIIVSAGHTNATFRQGKEAFTKISNATHLFNAMSPLFHRAPGMVGAIYHSPSVSCSIVADGVHVDYAAISISKGIMRDRLFLITDAVTDTETGPYQHQLKDDHYVVSDGTLSGSALTMMKAVANCVNHCNIPLTEALKMATVFPARALRLEGERGMIRAGQIAQFVVFDDSLQVISIVDPA